MLKCEYLNNFFYVKYISNHFCALFEILKVHKHIKISNQLCTLPVTALSCRTCSPVSRDVFLRHLSSALFASSVSFPFSSCPTTSLTMIYHSYSFVSHTEDVTHSPPHSFFDFPSYCLHVQLVPDILHIHTSALHLFKRWFRLPTPQLSRAFVCSLLKIFHILFVPCSCCAIDEESTIDTHLKSSGLSPLG